MSSPYYEVHETLVTLDNVSVAYGDKVILKDVQGEIKNLHRPGLDQGQVVALLGPSGMGKTTLFRVMAGLMEPTAGAVRLRDGHVVQRGEVGVVFQNYILFDHRTVIGNLVAAAKTSKVANGEDRARDILKTFGLSDHADRYPSQLSGGQRQRVAIAQQILCSSELLLMDEPFSGLDVNAISTVIRLVQEVAQSNELKTLVIVTHDIEAAVEVADCIWLLGRDRAPDGTLIPGARIREIINLAEMGLAWNPHVTDDPRYLQVCTHIRKSFPTL